MILEDLKDLFIPDNHPFVKARRMTVEEAGMQFDEGIELVRKIIKG